MASVIFTPFAVWLLLLAKGNKEKKNWTRGIEITLNNLTHTMGSMERTARSQQSVLADILATQPDEPLQKR